MSGKQFCITIIFLICLLSQAVAADRSKGAMLKKIFVYPTTIDTTTQKLSTHSYTYIKYNISTDKRNLILLAVPTMYAVAHSGQRRHISETYDSVCVNTSRIKSAHHILQRSTIPHGRNTMPTLVKYLTPEVYGETLINDFILSPFHHNNRRFYRFSISSFAGSHSTLTFRPKVRSTQLVTGKATFETKTGRIIDIQLSGEYDMILFTLNITMGSKGVLSLYPDQCVLEAKFKFMGNKITTRYASYFGLPQKITPQLRSLPDTTLFKHVRPVPLTTEEDSLFSVYYKQQEQNKMSAKKKSLSRRMWDEIGETLLGRITSNFGESNRGHVRVNPILNPLYFGYSGRKGLTYKFDVQTNYSFSDNQKITLRLKSGYSFKQKQLFYTIPAVYYFNLRRNGYIELEVSGGNRITNSLVADAIKNESPDSINWSSMQLDYFKNSRISFNLNYDFSPKFGINTGIVLHRRSAVDRKPFELSQRPNSYTSAAPQIEFEIRPWGYNGAIITADYERGIKGFLKANTEYEKYEFDAQYKRPLPSLSSLQMRLGAGFYSHKGKDSYFLDYSNFKENNIPGGWNDNWANEFELLNSNWYNASKYYVRANLTYESPILLVAWIPWVGRFIEKERIYMNILDINRLHPYIEYGYGIATHIFSAGIFTAQQNGHFDGIGVRFGIELFRQW